MLTDTQATEASMLGPLIGITTSIATTAAIGVARAGAAAVTSGGRQAPVRTRRIVVRQNADEAIERLGQELMRERALRMQLQAQNQRLQEMVDVAQDAIDELMQQRAA